MFFKETICHGFNGLFKITGLFMLLRENIFYTAKLLLNFTGNTASQIHNVWGNGDGSIRDSFFGMDFDNFFFYLSLRQCGGFFNPSPRSRNEWVETSKCLGDERSLIVLSRRWHGFCLSLVIAEATIWNMSPCSECALPLLEHLRNLWVGRFVAVMRLQLFGSFLRIEELGCGFFQIGSWFLLSCELTIR